MSEFEQTILDEIEQEIRAKEEKEYYDNLCMKELGEEGLL